VAVLAVVIEHERAGQRSRLMEPLVPVDVPIQEPLHPDADEVVLDIAAQVVCGLNRQSLGLEEGEHVRVLIHVAPQTIVGVGRGLETEGLPDQVGHHPALLPRIVRVRAAVTRVEQPVLAIGEVGVFGGETRQEDATGPPVALVSRQEPGLRQRPQAWDRVVPIRHVGVLAEEVVPLALVQAPIPVVRELPGGQVAVHVVIARVPLATQPAADLVRVVDGVCRPRGPGMELAHLLSVDGAERLRIGGPDARDPRRRLHQPDEVIRLLDAVRRRPVLPPDEVVVGIAFLNALEDLGGPGLPGEVLAAAGHARRGVVRRLRLSQSSGGDHR